MELPLRRFDRVLDLFCGRQNVFGRMLAQAQRSGKDSSFVAGAVQGQWQEPFLLRVLDPAANSAALAASRAVILLLGMLAMLAISFKGLSGDSVWAIAVAGIFAAVLLRLGVFVMENFVFNAHVRSRANGMYPPVAWMSAMVFLELVHTTLVNLVDPRQLDARKSDAIRGNAEVHDERSSRSQSGEEFFFDFVADTGDGFNGTYVVASLMAKAVLSVTEYSDDGRGESVELPRANVVFHGGDICYPSFSFENFFYRFSQPYAWAFPEEQGNGETMYFATGNHEYIDGLAGFQQFLLPLENIGGWKTPQKGSYFAVRLPMDWTVFVIDLGPEPEDMDEDQEQFFNSIELGENGTIILIYHVPDFIKVDSFGFSNYKRLRAFRAQLGSRVRLVLVGDLHYYRRYEEHSDGDFLEVESDKEVSDCKQNVFETPNRQFIVAGHGGAFSHVTHFPKSRRLFLKGAEETNLYKMSEFPSEKHSKKIWDKAWSLMFLTTTNVLYARLLGSAYMFAFWGVNPVPFFSEEYSFFTLLRATAITPFFYASFVGLLVMHIVIVAVSYQFSTLREVTVALLLILSHTAAHTCFAFGVRYVLDLGLLEIISSSVSFGNVFAYALLANLGMFLGGSIGGIMIITLYFRFAVECFQWHYNEASSMLQLEDFKGFLRIGIDPKSGDLDIYSIVTEESPRIWHERASDGASKFDSNPEYFLLERVSMTKSPFYNQ